MKHSSGVIIRYAPGFLRIGVTLLAIWLLFSLYKPSDVARLVSNLDASALLTAITIYAVCVHISAWKWGVLLDLVPYQTRLRAVVASCFYSILPSGQLGGELSKVLIVKSRHPEIDNVLATVVFDKLTGVIGLMLIGVASFLISDVYRAHWGMALVVSAVAVCGCILFATQRIANTVDKVHFSNKVLRYLQLRISSALLSIGRFSRNPSVLVRSVSLGILSQITVIMVYLVIANAIQIDLHRADMISAIVLANLATLLPISIAGFGVREAGLTAILTTQHGVSGEKALALSLTAMIIFLLPAAAGAVIEINKIIRR
jgi:glycosyltransferase 2 family protein